MSSSRKVVIDDTDSRIRYSGQGWFQDQGSQDNSGNFGPTYKRTSHGTNGNDSLSLTFQGTSIRVVGTTKLSRINETHWDPSWECFVDQISIGATKPFAFPENNWSLCQQSVLNDGQHEITVKVTSAGTTFWLDYLTFTPSPEVSYDETVLLVENSDAGILYDSSWGALGGTANMTTKKGSQVKFDFIGKSVTWVGFIPTELSHNAGFGSYSIDGGAPVTFKLNGLSPTATVTVYNQVFFTTPDLTPGPHSLVVTYNGANEGAATPLTLDYLYVTNTSLPSSSSPSVGFTSSLSPTPSPSSGTISQETQGQDSGPPVGGIVGGVLGGLALIALLLFLLWWRRGQQHRANLVSSSAPGLMSFGTNHTPQEVTPFMSMQPSAQPNTYTYTNPPLQPQRAPASTASAGISHSEFNSAPTHSQSLNTNDSSHATQSESAPRTHTQNRSNDSSDFSGYAPVTVAQTRAMRKGQEAGAPQPSVTSVLHQDSGIRLPQHRIQNTVVEDVPPLYTVT